MKDRIRVELTKKVNGEEQIHRAEGDVAIALVVSKVSQSDDKTGYGVRILGGINDVPYRHFVDMMAGAMVKILISSAEDKEEAEEMIPAFAAEFMFKAAEELAGEGE